MGRVLHNNRGMALILTLLVVSFLVALTVELGTSVNWQLQAASNQADIVVMDAMVLSGLQLSRAALLADQLANDFDTGHDSWGSFEPDVLQGLFPEGAMDIQVEDLTGLLQINALVLTEKERKRRQKEQAAARQKGKKKGKFSSQQLEKKQRVIWKRFLTSGKFVVEDEDEAKELLDTLSDWLDKDDDERENGAEDGYYRSLVPAYTAANGVVFSPDELLLIRGWQPVLLAGDKEHAGIRRYLTAAGEDGKININTAPAEVLLALHPDMTEELASLLIKFRDDKDNRDALKSKNWYAQVNGFAGTGIQFDADLITVKSSYFQVVVTVQLHGITRVGRGVLHRLDNREQELLWWQVE